MGAFISTVTGFLGIFASLTQTQTNGKSVWGTLLAPLLPFFLTNNPLPHGYPWGTLTETNANPYNGYPTTGVIRTYDWTISRGVIAPDGYERPVLLVNGAFPGPLLEANWGDKIIVNVHNNITGPEDGTLIHWHGFLQEGTPWEDGTPGVSQCPIPPGKSFTYEFQATLYGSSWYHSHYSAQYSGGIVGPIVVYGPSTQAKYDIDIGPVMLSDWYHQDYFDILEYVMKPDGSPVVFSNNTLINGKNSYNCSSSDVTAVTRCTNDAGLAKFRFQKGKTHRMRLVNSGSEAVYRFQLDEHEMTVIAHDFVPVKPYKTKVVELGVGQRIDVLVKANAGSDKSSYWMRANATSCSLANQPFAKAVVLYDKAPADALPTTKPWKDVDPGTCEGEPANITEPLYPMSLPQPSYTATYPVELFRNETGSTLWKFNNVSARVDYNAPPLLLASLGNTSFPPIWNINNVGTNSSVRIIVTNDTPSPHPMHLHGYNMYVLASGPGLVWDGHIDNPKNPERRDVAMVQGGGYLVIQFDSNNPGVWPFHCHIAWHASGGFISSFLVQPDKVRAMTVPQTVAQTCRDWADWTKTHVPDQIDSGL